MSSAKQRIDWLDTAKALAIFCVYFWHFGEVTGYAFYFIIWFHVPLFFFLSGCMENISRKSSIAGVFVKGIKTLLIPALFFTALSLIVYIAKNGIHIEALTSIGLQLLRGIVRNSFFAFSLWFFTCLFVVRVMFSVIKLLKFRILIVGAGFFMYMIANYYIHPNPIFEPHMCFNIDSAFFYMIYYASGFAAFPYIEKLLKHDTETKKRAVIITGIITFVYCLLLFFGKDVFVFNASSLEYTPFAMLWRAFIIITFVIILSYFLRNVKPLALVGQSTLFLCGNEYIIKELAPMCLGLFGISINYDNPLYLCIYTVILIAAVCLLLMPPEKFILKSCKVYDK